MLSALNDIWYLTTILLHLTARQKVSQHYRQKDVRAKYEKLLAEQKAIQERKRAELEEILAYAHNQYEQKNYAQALLVVQELLQEEIQLCFLSLDRHSICNRGQFLHRCSGYTQPSHDLAAPVR